MIDIISGKDKCVFTYLYLGGLGYGFKGKQRQTVKNRIYNSVNAHGRVKINTPLGRHPEGGRNGRNVKCKLPSSHMHRDHLFEIRCAFLKETTTFIIFEIVYLLPL